MKFFGVPENIEKVRKILDVSVEKMAEMAGISKSSMYRRFRFPESFTLGELSNICEGLGISLNQLINLKGESE